MNNEIKKRIQEFAVDQLTADKPKTKKSNTVAVDGAWNAISARKWEFRFNGVVLGTIFHKPVTNRYSLWVSVPVVVQKVHSFTYETYQFDTFNEAEVGFRKVLLEKCMPWCKSVIEFLNV